MNKMNKKGFTLIEMLVVIAIIAILVAIIIPVVSAATEKAQESSDAANIRSAIAEVTANGLSENKSYYKLVKLEQSEDFDKAFAPTDKIGGFELSNFNEKEQVYVVYTASTGDVSIAQAAPSNTDADTFTDLDA